MPRLIPLPDEFSDRPFSIAEAGEAGIRAGRLRSPDLRTPFRAVRAPRDLPADVEALCAGFGLQMAPDQFFSHVTAARLHGLPLPLRLERVRMLDVSVELPAQCPRMRGVRGHRVTVCGVTTIGSHRVASPVDVWCQLSTVLDLDELIMVGDALVRRIHPLATMDELRAAVLRHSGHRGARRLREALEWVRPGVDSPKETEVRLIIVRGSLPEPAVNGKIMNRYGAVIATGDLVYHRYRVLVEYDGGQHRTDEEQFHWDIDRLDNIMEEGWRVIRINKSHTGRPLVVTRKVETALRAAGWRPASSPASPPTPSPAPSSQSRE